MSTIRSVLKAAEAAEAMVKTTAPPNSLTAALEAFRASGLAEALADVRSQTAHLKAIQAEYDRFTSLIRAPALDVLRSLGSVFDDARMAPQLAAEARMAGDWAASLQAAGAWQVPPTVPLEAHFAKLFEYSALAESALRDVRVESFGALLGVDEGLGPGCSRATWT